MGDQPRLQEIRVGESEIIAPTHHSFYTLYIISTVLCGRVPDLNSIQESWENAWEVNTL